MWPMAITGGQACPFTFYYISTSIAAALRRTLQRKQQVPQNRFILLLLLSLLEHCTTFNLTNFTWLVRSIKVSVVHIYQVQ